MTEIEQAGADKRYIIQNPTNEQARTHNRYAILERREDWKRSEIYRRFSEFMQTAAWEQMHQGNPGISDWTLKEWYIASIEKNVFAQGDALTDLEVISQTEDTGK